MNVNPVLLKEIKVRMRSWKVVCLIIAYLSVLALVALFLMFSIQRQMYYSNMDPSMTVSVYTTLAVMQFMLIVFIAPSLTSGTISGERERQTLDLLLCTKMPSRSIIIGKLFSSISQVILLVVASFPVFSIVFMFGGISALEVFKLFLFYIVVSITMGSIGIFFSTYIKKTTASNVMTYGFVLFLLFGTLFINVFYTSFLIRGTPYNKVFPLSYINPLTGFVSLLSDQFGGYGMAGSILPGVYIPLPRTSIQRNTGLDVIPLWQINLAANLILSSVLIFLSTIKINPIKRRRFKKIKK
ncbi:ABC transporter permease [Clostridium sp. SYSU_GA19001]|uniref:ABC transporter permease n=1 Tax=Clostridium caldaquaticum TaxID=2940653 RepID=UPI0020771C14|nr:ABC transporter permease subunit [Clostridium caldaquaticum]MCM8711790.1 ABC transporter permease [Clostridium caldaquaticum]